MQFLQFFLKWPQNPESKEAKTKFATVSFGNKVLFIGMTNILSSVWEYKDKYLIISLEK